MPYIGNIPATQFASLTYQDLTGGSGTTFTLDSPVGSAQDIEVFVNNVRQEPGVAYNITGSTGLTMTGSIASTDDFYVVFQGKSIGTVSHPSGSALEASTGTFSGALSATTGTFSGALSATTGTFSDNVDINGNDLILDADGDTKISASTDDVLTFDTAASERMRITATGAVLVATTDENPASNNVAGIKLESSGTVQFSRSGTSVVQVNRLQDGTIVTFRSAGNVEGSIGVSGTTVSYNGGHLSRWSRLIANNKDTSILKGTVMTNLDAMVEWGDEDNEQLNKMAVSSVEGDINVSGVFVSWDEDDDWNDMNIAMTGDMVIRIAQGTTVARGDLLMSAGDGTAKPQGDDIVRSKTIAKVTSTNVSHTYDDGSYLVPCVLMAC